MDHRAKSAHSATREVRQAERPNWAGQGLRLDPYRLPMRISFDREDGLTYTIDRQGAVMKRKLSCGLPVAFALPAAAFRGVAARAFAEADGKLTVTLELNHHDPALCVPLLVSDNLDDIAADWHCWSRLLRLPMLVAEGDEQMRPVREQLGAILVETPQDRRKRFTSPKHRPWFLRRRKTGIVGPIVRLTGEEIIARS